MQRMALGFCFCSCLASLCGCRGSNSTITSLNAIEILPPSNALGTRATGINDKGQVSGNITGGSAFLTDGKTMNLIAPLPGDTTCSSVGLDSAGDVVGSSVYSAGGAPISVRPFVYRAGSSVPVAIPAGDSLGTATAISPSGAVAGSSSATTNVNHMFFTSGTSVVTIPFTTGDTEGVPNGINSAGVVVGYSEVPLGAEHGFLFNSANGTLAVIPALSGDTTSRPTAINTAGLIIGYSYGGGGYHSYVYDSGTGTLTQLSLLAGDNFLQPNGVNSHGQIVGGHGGDLSGSNVGQPRAFLYQNGAAVDINTLLPASVTSVWTFYNAVGINDSGQIAANALRADGTIHAFRLSPKSFGAGGAVSPGDAGGGGVDAGGNDASPPVDGGAIDLGSPNAGPATYAATTEILPPGADTVSQAVAINSSGEVTGVSYSTGARRGFLATNGVAVAIDPLPGDLHLFPAALDDSGAVVGYSTDDTGDDQAIVYSAGTTKAIPMLPGDSLNRASGINASGKVVGYSALNGGGPNHPARAFLYASGTSSAIALPPGDIEGYAVAINDSGRVIGTSAGSAVASSMHGFLYDPVAGTSSLLPTLPGHIWNSPVAINASGEIVGTSSPDLEQLTAYVIDTMSHVTAIAPLAGDLYSQAAAINGKGQVVGTSSTDTTSRPFLYQNGVAVDVNTLLPASFTSVWLIYAVVGINDSGQLAANAKRKADGVLHAYVLSPINAP